jgi:hypothetical protein
MVNPQLAHLVGTARLHKMQLETLAALPTMLLTQQQAVSGRIEAQAVKVRTTLGVTTAVKLLAL